jgi:D-alanyl-D-alanine carboxypeptidase
MSTRPNIKTKLIFVLGLIVLLFFCTIFYLLKTKHVISVSALPPAAQYQHPPIPQIISKNIPNLLAQNYILVDNLTNTILLSKNPHSRIYPASTTKLATALTALNIYPLDEVVSIGVTYSEGKVMELKTGENITIRSLVTALLVYSANDSAFNLASHHQNGVTGFVKEMNLIAQKYNLLDSHFVNYDGIHSPDHYSSVYDLSQLGRLAIKNPIIKDTVKNKKITVTDITGKTVHALDSTNELLDVIPEIKGLKTGWTPEAGGCFVSLINNDGHELIGVVAQSDDRFADTKALVNWSKSSLAWQPYK